MYTDKYEVRKYVEKTIGAKYLNHVIGLYDSFQEIDFDSLPDAFALKATHGSSYNIIVTDKEKLDRKAAKDLIIFLIPSGIYFLSDTAMMVLIMMWNQKMERN
ncbi:hypothetical protein H7U36_06200 [Faecalicatena fissicatena]|uniref:Uncharacterized protein n=2 Tax=Faecalicatena fissicatena TaxID=290055 RepID=A0ABS2E7T8_9FIRM|nr:hypothetical protein [Faecalicatena fissicatena]